MADRNAILGSIEDFGKGFKDSALQPIEGFLQVTGIHKPEPPKADPAEKPKPAEKLNSSAKDKDTEKSATSPSSAYSAGTMVGQAFDFTAVQLIAKKIPGLGSLRSASAMVAGGGIGFLSANEAGKNSILDRFESAALGAGTIGVMEGSNFALGKMGLNDTVGMSFVKNGISGAVTGALTTQVSEKVNAGHWATAGETLAGAASWAGTGLALGGASELAGRAFKGARARIGNVTGAGSSDLELSKSDNAVLLKPSEAALPIIIESAPLVVPPLEASGHAAVPLEQVAPPPEHAALPTERAALSTEHAPPSPEALQKLHPLLPLEQAQLLSSVISALAKDESESPAPFNWNVLVDKNFDASAYLKLYQRLQPSTERYAVIMSTKEEWLAKMSLRITRAFGADAERWLDAEPGLKEKDPNFGEYNLGAAAQRASYLPIPQGEVGLSMKSLLLRDHTIGTAQLKQLFEHGQENPAGSAWLMTRSDEEIKAAAQVWTQLPKLPAPLAVEYANRPPIERLAAELAWSNTADSLPINQRQLIETTNYDPANLDRFTAEYNRLQENGSTAVLERANNVAYTVKELYPDLTPTEARGLADGARGAARNVRDRAQEMNASQLLSAGIDTTQFLSALAKLESSTPVLLDIHTSYDKPTRAFELVKTLGSDWSGWLEGQLKPDGKLKDATAFAGLRLPITAAGQPFRDFLMEHPDLSIRDLNTISKGLEHVPASLRSEVLAQPKSDVVGIADATATAARTGDGGTASSAALEGAIQSWEIEPRLPWAIASRFGGSRSIENAAAIVAYRELAGIKIEPVQEEIIDLRDIPTPRRTTASAPASTTEVAPTLSDEQRLAKEMASGKHLADPAFGQFNARYAEVLARGKYQIAAQLHSLAGAIRIFHPSLSRVEAGYMEAAAQSAEGRHSDPQSLVHANVKAGTFAKVLRRLAGSQSELPDDLTWQPGAALSATNIFGRDANQWLSMQRAKGLEFHDATHWLPTYSPKEAEGLGKFLLKNDWREPRDIALVARRWSSLTQEEKNSNFTKLVRGLRSQIYPNATSNSFMQEASRWDVNPKDYPDYERRYIASLSTPPMVASSRVWQSGGLKGYFLPRSDERGIFLGEHTNCCQHPGAPGDACAWFGQENARSGFFVVTDKAGSVVAQSWAWLADKGGLVFDSLESKGLGGRAEGVAQIYDLAASDLSKEFGTVTLGTGTDRLDISRWPSAGEDSQPLPEAYGKNYTDARKQVLLAKSEIVAPTTSGTASGAPSVINLSGDTAPAARRASNYVFMDNSPGANPLRPRPVVRALQTDDDWQQASRIARTVYPDEFDYVSEGETTLLLDASNKGVIGYATIDIRNHEVNDLAVLPNFRPYSQTLMRGVYAYLKTVQTSPGEVWNATLRASTTDRLLNFYDRQGKIKILSRQPAEDAMHGEPMYDVKFTVQ